MMFSRDMCKIHLKLHSNGYSTPGLGRGIENWDQSIITLIFRALFCFWDYALLAVHLQCDNWSDVHGIRRVPSI